MDIDYDAKMTELMTDWKEKELHKGKKFISDGIMNKDGWNKPNNKKILFVLKEAYGNVKNNSLADDLTGRKNHPKMWKRVIEWTYGIQETTESKIAPYSSDIYKDNKELIKSIAVVNIKKSDGKPRSDYDEIRSYASADKDDIKDQIKLISPKIIICGSTFSALNENVYDRKICAGDDSKCENWFYYTSVLTGEETLVIDYYHPAVQWAALANYYAITNIYQQALLNKN